MQLDEAKEQFIQTWGTLGSNWGINRAMAQIHALLLLSPAPLSTEDIMEKLSASRGNTNMNTRELIAWGLVRKELKAGDRKEYFVAEKDIFTVVQCIIRERKKRELDPLRRALEGMTQNLEGDEASEDIKLYKQVVGEIKDLTGTADKVLTYFEKAEKTWFFKQFMKLFS
ncbi:MAG: transcriptional regulator [Bacteroidetes bacterium]|nr:MAG: transcriptional regulator [Bacteroidota bacterium]